MEDSWQMSGTTLVLQTAVRGSFHCQVNRGICAHAIQVWTLKSNWLGKYGLKGAPDPVARELYFQTEYCMNIIQIPHSRTL